MSNDEYRRAFDLFPQDSQGRISSRDVGEALVAIGSPFAEEVDFEDELWCSNLSFEAFLAEDVPAPSRPIDGGAVRALLSHPPTKASESSTHSPASSPSYTMSSPSSPPLKESVNLTMDDGAGASTTPAVQPEKEPTTVQPRSRANTLAENISRNEKLAAQTIPLCSDTGHRA